MLEPLQVSDCCRETLLLEPKNSHVKYTDVCSSMPLSAFLYIIIPTILHVFCGKYLSSDQPLFLPSKFGHLASVRPWSYRAHLRIVLVQSYYAGKGSQVSRSQAYHTQSTFFKLYFFLFLDM